MTIDNELIAKINSQISWTNLYYECIWRLIVVLHFAVIILNMISLVVIPWYEPFYISIPIISFEWNLIFNRSWTCPLTDWENKFRILSGYEPIGKFVKYYILNPLKKPFK